MLTMCSYFLEVYLISRSSPFLFFFYSYLVFILVSPQFLFFRYPDSRDPGSLLSHTLNQDMGNTNQNQFQDQQSPRSKAEVVQERRRARAIKVILWRIKLYLYLLLYQQSAICFIAFICSFSPLSLSFSSFLSSFTTHFLTI